MVVIELGRGGEMDSVEGPEFRGPGQRTCAHRDKSGDRA